MTKSKQRLRVSGAVLVMVLIVMVVLIMMLMATLTVVTSAGQRIYTKYEENQAYYSARSALDIFTQSMLEDAEYYAYDSTGIIQYHYTDDDGNAATANMKQGLALQGELYKITSQGEKTMKVAQNMSDAAYKITDEEDARVAIDFAENMALDEVFPVSSGENAFFSVSSTALNDSTDAKEKFEYIEYQVVLPELTDGSDKYGAMVDEDSTGKQIATIKVEVLDRLYGMAGNYGNNETEIRESIVKIIKDNDPAKIAQLKQDIIDGDRSKDKFTLKITSTVKYMDNEGVAVLIYDSSERPAVNSNQAITTVNDLVEGSGLFALGGASSLSTARIALGESAVVIGNLFLKGSIDQDGQFDAYMYKDTIYTVFGDIKFPQRYLTWKEPGSIIFSQGTVTLDAGADFGESGKETNLIASTVKLGANFCNVGTFYGNIYSDVFYLPSGNTPSITGGVYTDYVDITEYMNTLTNISTTTQFNANITGSNLETLAATMSIAKGFVINVDDDNDSTTAPVATKFEWDGGTGLTRILPDSSVQSLTILTDSVPMPSAFTQNTANEIKINYYDPNEYTYDNDMKVFTMPVNLAGRTTKEFEVSTVKSLYKNIFQETAFVNDAVDTGKNGELNNILVPTFDTTGVTISYTDMSGSTNIAAFSDAFLKKFTEDDLASIGDWEIGTYIDKYVADGEITAEEGNNIKARWQDEYDWSVWPANVYPGIKNTIISGLATAKQNDATYQAALAAYYQNYITGAEKAGEVSCPDLLKYKSDQAPITIKTIATDPTVAAPEDFQAGGKYSALSSSTQIIDSSGYLCSTTKTGTQYGTNTNPIIIDARTNDLVIQLGAENGMGGNKESGSTLQFRGYFVVVGDKTVKVYLPDGRDYELGSTASGQGFYLSTYDIHTATDLKLGTAGTLTPSPNVYMYAGNNVKNVSASTPGKERLITAHIYIPFANYTMGADSGATYSNITYNGINVSNSNGFSVIGSLIAGSYSSGNKSGVAYINPNVSTTAAGDPHLTWIPKQYVRN